MWDEAAVDAVLNRYHTSGIGLVWAQLMRRVKWQPGFAADALASAMDWRPDDVVMAAEDETGMR